MTDREREMAEKAAMEHWGSGGASARSYCDGFLAGRASAAEEIARLENSSICLQIDKQEKSAEIERLKSQFEHQLEVTHECERSSAKLAMDVFRLKRLLERAEEALKETLTLCELYPGDADEVLKAIREGRK